MNQNDWQKEQIRLQEEMARQMNMKYVPVRMDQIPEYWGQNIPIPNGPPERQHPKYNTRAIPKPSENLLLQFIGGPKNCTQEIIARNAFGAFNPGDTRVFIIQEDFTPQLLQLGENGEIKQTPPPAQLVESFTYGIHTADPSLYPFSDSEVLVLFFKP